MKHIKLFEAFGLLKNSGFSPEDSIQSGDTAFCWNFEDGWMVTLLDRVLASKMMDHLEESESRLVDEPKYSNEKGVVFVATGIPTDLSVEFKKENFDTSSFENLVNSQEDIENNLEGEFTGSCVFTLKRNHVIGYRWNGGQFCIPIEEYFEEYGETVSNNSEKFKVTIELDSENPDATYGCTVEGIGDTLEEAARFAFALVCKFIVSGEDCEDLKDLNDFEDITENIYSKEDVENAISSIVQSQELEPNFFADHGTDSTNTIEVERGMFPKNGGFLIDQYSYNKYE